MDGNRALLTYAWVMGTTERVQLSKASESENAFAVWADAYPNAIRLRRAVDLVMPPFSSAPIVLKMEDTNPREFFASIEEAKFTGCIKVDCQQKLSRSALILYSGRAVGLVYTTKLIVEPYPFEDGLRRMLQDVQSADARMEMYDLPGDLVLSMSALFLGYADQNNEDLDNFAYADKIIAHLAARKETACLSLVEESLAPCALSYITNGEFKGTFAIAERTFGEEQDFFRQVLEKYPKMRLHAHILPAAMLTDSVRFGYSLTSPQFASG